MDERKQMLIHELSVWKTNSDTCFNTRPDIEDINLSKISETQKNYYIIPLTTKCLEQPHSPLGRIILDTWDFMGAGRVRDGEFQSGDMQKLWRMVGDCSTVMNATYCH